MQPFAGFDQRPDNKFWLFYEKSGNFRLRKVYVFAYTWFDARDGALVGLNPSTRDVEGDEIESPEDVMLDEGSTIVFAGTKQGQFEIIELLRRMSGKEASKLVVFKPAKYDEKLGEVLTEISSESAPTEDLEILTSIREKLENTKVVKSNGLATTSQVESSQTEDEIVWLRRKLKATEELLATLTKSVQNCAGTCGFGDNDKTTRPLSHVPLCVDCAETWQTICQTLKSDEPCVTCAFALHTESDLEVLDSETLNTIFAESTEDEPSLRELQVSLPWTIRYSRDFRANPQSHKNFAHALVHVHKAAGKLAALVDDMDHDRAVADDSALRETHAKYIADLVVCALRLANEFPGGHVDLQKAVIERIQTKNTPESPEPSNE